MKNRILVIGGSMNLSIAIAAMLLSAAMREPTAFNVGGNRSPRKPKQPNPEVQALAQQKRDRKNARRLANASR
jgi:hypothetical protein